MKTAAQLRVELEQARAALTAATPAFGGDPAMARLGPVALRQHHKRTDRELERYSAALQRVERLEWALSAATAREVETARVRLRAPDVQGARFIRTRHGWHKVVRVNGATVTVEASHCLTERIPLGKVLEVRR